ncbi:Protein SIP5 [Cladobotryum mycophilum]|uniref:Protein SIP5 n=1 Tax=Cladobotryum mycophilum TaxID=491253 RepID=A0ABR0SUE0_9HYPO
MGNANTKESRHSDYPDGFSDGRDRRPDLTDAVGIGRSYLSESSMSRNPRNDRTFLSLGNGSSSRNRDRPDVPFEHRETRQEREARKLERERAARAKERERSIREEHVDGGFLVTLGTYTGTEDFSKPVVRQLQIERKLAPFWQGLNDWSDSWTELQLIAAARGLPIPAADALPEPELAPRLPQPLDAASGQNMNNLTVEMGPRTLSTASDSGSGAGSGAPSPAAVGANKGSIKPRARALAAALSVGSRNASSTDLAPKEMYLPYDPFVNGQPIESICSECFVQIKRADPHIPEHHPDGQARDPNQGLNPEDPPEMLISEPSSCPYCQQPEFGVTYEPPPFRRGLTLSSPVTNFGQSPAMSSQSSLNSTLSPNSPNPVGRRRTHSLSANAPNVITTDRIRPDWATKLATARAHQARRAAAATALHTAAFLMSGNESRSRLRTGRFGRRNTGGNSGGTSTPGGEQSGGAADAGPEPGERGSSARSPEANRRSRMEELEDMMFMEAIRLSLAAEEERKRKEEKTARKEAKKREKEEAKAAKKQSKDPYGGGLSGGSRSSLSLVLGRRRGDSTTSHLRMETSMQGTSQSPTVVEHPPEPTSKDGDGKGKGVDRGSQEQTTETSIPTVIEP